MKTCENCGSRVYNLGCVNCDEMNYIHEQAALTDLYESEKPRCRGCGSRGCDNPNCGPLDNEE